MLKYNLLKVGVLNFQRCKELGIIEKIGINQYDDDDEDDDEDEDEDDNEDIVFTWFKPKPFLIKNTVKSAF